MSHFDLALHQRLLESPTTATLSSGLDVTHTTRTMHLPCESIGDTRGYRDVVTLIKPESAEALERLTNPIIQQIARPHVIVTWGNNVGFIHQEQMWPPNIAQLCYGKKQWDFWSPFGTAPVRSVEYSQEHSAMVEPPALDNKREPDITLYQSIGDIVYIPEGWYHRVRTISNGAVMLGAYLPVKNLEVMYHSALYTGRAHLESCNNGEFEIAALHVVHNRFLANPNLCAPYSFEYMEEVLDELNKLLHGKVSKKNKIGKILEDAWRYARKHLGILSNKRDASGKRKRRTLNGPRKHSRNRK